MAIATAFQRPSDMPFNKPLSQRSSTTIKVHQTKATRSHCSSRQPDSTCTMVFELAQIWGCSLNADMATNLYAGLVFDTGAFAIKIPPPTHCTWQPFLSDTASTTLKSRLRSLRASTRRGQIAVTCARRILFLNEQRIAVGHIRRTDFKG